ncbi:MAG: class D sortase [Hydrogenoanaerobacterium sp.]
MKLVREYSPKLWQYRLLKLLSAVLIIAGLAVLIYPRATVMYQNYKEKKLLEGWQQSMALLAEPAQSTSEGDELKPQLGIEALQASDEVAALGSKDVVAVLEIDKIGLKSPVLRGTTKQNLGVALTTIEPTGTVGLVGNVAIAGHNNFDYGRHFNRLDELERGDEITITDLTQSYTYVVIEKLVLKPDETAVLRQSNTQSLLTLVTCTPRETAAARLIVRAELKPKKAE